jgi:antirestriction protein ArdC
MKSEEVKRLVTNAIDDLRAALDAGRTEELTRYLAAMGRFHRYSMHNVFLIALQKPNASHVAGFHTWKNLGRHVKKGERGIFILAPMLRKKRDTKHEARDADEILMGFHGCAVFDYSQTEGRELPGIGTVEGDPARYHERLERFVADVGIELRYTEDIAPARGMSEGGKIALLSGMSPAETFATLVHECAHELLHRGANRPLLSKRHRETEAEATAYVVCHTIGLETGTASQNYIQLYNGDAALLVESLENIRSASSKVLAGIAPSEPMPRAD